MPFFNSTAVKRAEYDPQSMRMTLWFPEMKPYSFCRVPQRIYDGLCTAGSKGSYYNANIRDRYQC